MDFTGNIFEILPPDLAQQLRNGQSVQWNGMGIAPNITNSSDEGQAVVNGYMMNPWDPKKGDTWYRWGNDGAFDNQGTMTMNGSGDFGKMLALWAGTALSLGMGLPALAGGASGGAGAGAAAAAAAPFEAGFAGTSALSGVGGVGGLSGLANAAGVSGLGSAASSLGGNALSALLPSGGAGGGWSSLTGPLASAAGGALSANAAGDAANAQLQAAREAMALQEPFRQGGMTAMNRLMDLLGLSGRTGAEGYGSAARNFGLDDFEADPGYAFRQQQGEQALERSAAARGGLLSGRAAKDTMRFSQGLASQEYGNAFNRFQTNRANQLNPLQSLMGAGQTAAGTIGNLTTQAGDAQAAGTVGRANAWNQALGQGVSSYQQNELMNRLLNGRGF